MSRTNQFLKRDASSDSCKKRNRPWSLLLERVNLAGGLGQDSPLGDEDDVLARELLLKLADQPGLDLLERLQLRNLKRECSKD